MQAALVRLAAELPGHQLVQRCEIGLCRGDQGVGIGTLRGHGAAVLRQAHRDFGLRVGAGRHGMHLVEQQLRLSVESPQLLAAIEILLPLAKAEYRQLSGPRSSGCDPRVAELIKNEADAWAIGIALAEDALQRIGPCPQLLARYFHQLEKALTAAKAVQP